MIGGPPGMAHLIFRSALRWPGRFAKLSRSQPLRRRPGGSQDAPRPGGLPGHIRPACPSRTPVHVGKREKSVVAVCEPLAGWILSRYYRNRRRPLALTPLKPAVAHISD